MEIKFKNGSRIKVINPKTETRRGELSTHVLCYERGYERGILEALGVLEKMGEESDGLA